MLRRLPEVLPVLRGLANQHPWHESLNAWLMIALAASGQQAAALDIFDQVRRRLAEELGVDPGSELIDARQEIIEGRADARETAKIVADRSPIPHQVPPPPADFTGRAEHLDRLERLLISSTRRSGSRQQTVCVISGMPGVGKTSLALRSARAVRSAFPEGQLHIDLRGADLEPVSTAAAVSRLLRGLGVKDRAIPGDPDEACALYRSLLAERRVLVVLDNAHDAAQIRPLLPGSGGSATLITARNRCAELEGAVHLSLPELSVDESIDMLEKCSGTHGVSNDPEAAHALIEACGRCRLRCASWPAGSRPGRTGPSAICGDV